ncbi:unnamed protein product [Prunus brigantina]
MSSDKSEVSLIRFNGKNYSAWAFHFGIFVKGKEAWGHVDGSNPAPDKNKDKDQHAKWEVKDAQVMTWILGSVEPNIILNLRSSQTAAQMWTYLKKIYSQRNTARRFQLEHELAALQQDSLSISDFYSRFTNLWGEYTDIVYADLPSEGLSSVQSVHETTQRDQFLMKLRHEFEGTRSNLMNRESVPSLDTCLNDLLREEQRLLTQTTMEQRRSASVPVAYAAQGKPRGRDMSTVQCFSCKGFGHYAANCPRKFCNYCRKDGHIIKECPTRPPKKSETAYTVSVGSSSAGSSVPAVSLTQSAPAPVQPVTPDTIQQMIISAFSALGLSGKPFSTSSPWYFDSGASHHMTNNADSLTNVNKYFGNLKIHTADGNHLPITATGDVSSSLTDVFVSPGLSTNLVSTQFSAHIKILRSDNGGEYTSHLFQDFLQTHGIISQRSCPSTPQQNGVAERKNRHLLDVVRTLLLELSTPSRFWCEALSTAVHLINRLPSPTLHHNSPFTKLFGRPPSYSNLRTFGCVCYVHLPAHERTKLTAQSIQCAFLGYSVHQKGFLCYDPNLRRIRVSRNVIFLENQYFFPTHQDPVSPSFSVLPMFTNSFAAPVLNISSPAPVPSQPLLVYRRRSSATSHQPPAPPQPPPAPSPTAAPVPATAPPPLRQSTRVRRPPDSKFVFSVKLHSDGFIDRYKARLVAFGNKQEYGLDYDETFAPVAKMTTVRTILALAASQSWPLHQMDVKNAFLHGDLKEEVYLKLPSGMPTSSPNDVCKLKRSLYGLKQAPRVWFEKFRSTLLGFSFTQSQYDSSLFLQRTSMGIVVLLVYVDDIVITGSDLEAISAVQTLLHSTFHMKDLGQLTYFLGLEVYHQPHGLFLHQAQVQSRSGSVSRPHQHYFR